jgi:hypothetical protein
MLNNILRINISELQVDIANINQMKIGTNFRQPFYFHKKEKKNSFHHYHKYKKKSVPFMNYSTNKRKGTLIQFREIQEGTQRAYTAPATPPAKRDLHTVNTAWIALDSSARFTKRESCLAGAPPPPHIHRRHSKTLILKRITNRRRRSPNGDRADRRSGRNKSDQTEIKSE